ncbi:monovalent cation/H(+) antiporter subunit G [Haloferacaceae archaeon DSL9]
MVGIERAVLATALIAVGCFFLTVGTVGLIRFPNVYNRMHATSKPTTLGTATIFLAAVVYFWPGGASLTSLIGLVFLMITVPTGAHMIARSAQKMGVPFLGSVTWPDERPEGAEVRSDGDDRRVGK